VVAEEARFAVSLLLDGGGREHNREVTDVIVREYDPLFVLDELGHFFAYERRVLRG
jgi:hypothetical protein